MKSQYPAGTQTVFRTTISLPFSLLAAKRRANALGYTGFSNYIAYLIAQDLRERPQHITVREEKTRKTPQMESI